MADERFHHGSGRETRLLVLVVVVSVGVLLLLARFRFPSSDLTVVAPAPSPLAGLAARATFEDMAATVRTLLSRVTPLMLTVELVPVPASQRRSRSASPTDGTGPSQFVAAMRLQSHLALVPVPSGYEIATASGASALVNVVGTDTAREVAVVRVNDNVVNWSAPVADTPAGFQFVGAVGATAGGLTVQPVFIGRLDALTDARWPSTIFGMGPTTSVPVQTFLFSINGGFLGLTGKYADGIGIVPVDVLNAVIEQLVPDAGIGDAGRAPASILKTGPNIISSRGSVAGSAGGQ